MNFNNQEINNDFRNNTSNTLREEKIKMLLDYAKDGYREGHKPTKKEIRRKFHLEIYNYFRNIADYHEKAGIRISLRNYPKEQARRLIIESLYNKIKEGFYPNRKEIEKALKINFSTYFKNLKELYDSAKINYNLVEKAIKNKTLASHTHNKDTLNNQKSLIKKFILESVAKGVYPSVQHIQKELNLSFYNLYDNIFEAYGDANICYERPSPILLGRKKEEVFTKITKDLLVKMGFKIKRISIESEINFNRSADLTIEDKDDKLYLVEIKAYRKDCHISKREFEQLLKYLRKERTSNGIFITTSNTKRCTFDNIKFINGEKVIKLLKEYKLSKYIKLIKWVQKSRVNSKERERYKDLMKKKIFDYIKMKGNIPTKKEIQKNLKIDIRSVFGKPKPYEKLLKEIEKLGTFTPRT